MHSKLTLNIIDSKISWVGIYNLPHMASMISIIVIFDVLLLLTTAYFAIKYSIKAPYTSSEMLTGFTKRVIVIIGAIFGSSLTATLFFDKDDFEGFVKAGILIAYVFSGSIFLLIPLKSASMKIYDFFIFSIFFFLFILLTGISSALLIHHHIPFLIIGIMNLIATIYVALRRFGNVRNKGHNEAYLVGVLISLYFVLIIPILSFIGIRENGLVNLGVHKLAFGYLAYIFTFLSTKF